MTTQEYKQYRAAKKNVRSKMQSKVDVVDVQKQKQKRFNLLKKIS